MSLTEARSRGNIQFVIAETLITNLSTIVTSSLRLQLGADLGQLGDFALGELGVRDGELVERLDDDLGDGAAHVAF